ncbi:D-glycero-alpha-D-manno-heptose-1,7-bisphosphate 7-phosphatase [Methylocapsa palsarum]|uniref:D,D-heptose 1,7-bisphosphate phosphatase n=1 Tax=Methylocapsa palsarum TaxID=1612308 RepID=A0A1I4B179_9HYPH|nr:HAD family hydrolase [Methylocapsa palsarum]SFK62525.1 D-glycero-D-manno-heptose 1,7-bisphosphate phosphatase [Methylocapsa palsarum]
MLKPAIFLDRDGTIIEEKNYLDDPAEVKLLQGASEGLLALSAHMLPLVVVSNQSGVGRGYFSLAQAQAVQDQLRELLAREGVTIAGWYMCPHDPLDKCACRKPLPGMIRAACQDLSLDPSKSFMIGDKRCDIDLAAAVGATGILVTTGYGAKEADYARSIAAPVCGDLIEVSEVVARRLALAGV